MEETKKITAKDMEKYLAERYWDSRQWVFLSQVRSSTGGASRIADAMAFSMFASTGYEIIGFEIKVSRSDFLSELKDMSKSDEIMSYCDKWYLVVSDAKIVQDGELPKNWGLLVLKDGKLIQKTRPVPQRPATMPLSFIASILRRSGDEVGKIKNEYIKKEDIEEEVEKARKQGYDAAQGYEGRETKRSLDDLRLLVAEFQKASGTTLESWRGKEYAKSIGMYVKFAMELDERTLEYNIKHIESTVSSLQRAIIDCKKIKSNLITKE